MHPKLAKIISILFHPVVVPTLGILLLLNSSFYFSMLSWEAKRFILLVVFFTTCILPMLMVSLLALNTKFDINMLKSTDRILPLLASAVFYYLGFVLLGKVSVFPVLKLYMLASVLVIVALLVVSFKWKISNHMAALGGLTGTFLALSFRYGLNPVYSLLIIILVSGLVGTARLALSRHNIWQVIAGYSLGFLVLYLVVYFV
ncbi:phosphatase PAP2 family protein [Maribellus sp. YY47]|uniref:phosphatase PAP2 family protein n=1 Tax=Maribellus sp. YY47 TaxID=2929486 RepID=UPI0020014252|nr:phosphatase PAP2 family protein [Maribellus sp. YY47]MCK3683659.1 phosphatase PAP2 family protein [Maribellus sp. YY47]